jgi:hypothetical protein
MENRKLFYCSPGVIFFIGIVLFSQRGYSSLVWQSLTKGLGIYEGMADKICEEILKRVQNDG